MKVNIITRRLPATSTRLQFPRGTSLSAALLPFVVAACLFSGCGRPQAGGPPKSGGPSGPPVVDVVTLAASSVSLTKELTGRTSAFRVAEVRARVSGIILKRNFAEGSDVKEGQILFEIDAAPYRAALDIAKATLARAEANLAFTRVQNERYQSLLEVRAISKQDYDNSRATYLAGEADVASGRASVETATINLGYTSVIAPISGRIGRSAVTEGALVQQGQATLLATVQQLDPIYVDLTQSSNEWLQFKDDLASGRLKADPDGQTKVALITGVDRDYALPGRLEFSDVTVDPGTGSIAVRAVFPNPKLDLLPGMFVRALLGEGVDPAGILVPQTAVTFNSRGEASALVVNPAGKAELRALVAKRSIGNAWLVKSGLAAGDRVIVEGLQKVRPGMDVKIALAVPPPTASLVRADH